MRVRNRSAPADHIANRISFIPMIFSPRSILHNGLKRPTHCSLLESRLPAVGSFHANKLLFRLEFTMPGIYDTHSYSR
jgi:hypothetical protein